MKHKHGKGIVITVAGPHGSGRSTQAQRLAETFGLRYVSTGSLFRARAAELKISLEDMTRLAAKDPEFDKYLDSRSKEECRKGNVVLDATLSGWMAEDPDIKIYLTAPLTARVRRISEREGRDYGEVEHETRVREDIERERFKRYYDIDIDDLSVYDLVINTELFDVDETADILKNIVESYIGKKVIVCRLSKLVESV
jgi:cytidylate kinase